MNETIGYICCLIAGICFGSNFLPVKKFEVGDGIMFQWVMCAGIWMVGLITVAFEEDRHVHTTAMIGGALWAIGNVMCIQVIKMIGMSMGLMVWGITNSVTGWASGRFGILGASKEAISHADLNYAGLALTLVSLALFAHVKPTITKPDEEVDDTYAAMADRPSDKAEKTDEEGEDWIDNLSPRTRFIGGFSLALLCGGFFGVTFNPAIYETNHGGTHRLFDYVFSHFCGIFIMSTAIMLTYCAVKKNNPWVNPQVILPGVASGVIWSIAQVCWFIAIQNLQMVVANPIVTSLPSIVAGFWGIVVFGEIRGLQNIALFFGGLTVAVTGVILVALSN